MKKPLGYLILLLVALGGLAYFNKEPSGPLLPPDDPLAIKALDLVKTHEARHHPTIAQALTNLVEEIQASGRPFRNKGWRVSKEAPDLYVVSLLIREKGERGWIERDFAWRVNVQENWIKVITLAASSVMPLYELPPLPHSDQIS